MLNHQAASPLSTPPPLEIIPGPCTHAKGCKTTAMLVKPNAPPPPPFLPPAQHLNHPQPPPTTPTARSLYVKGYKTTAKLIKPDAVAGASIVHVIDRVLIPDLT